MRGQQGEQSSVILESQRDSRETLGDALDAENEAERNVENNNVLDDLARSEDTDRKNEAWQDARAAFSDGDGETSDDVGDDLFDEEDEG